MKRGRQAGRLLILVSGDLILTFLALSLAELGRHRLTFGDPISVHEVYLTPQVFAVVGTIWLSVSWIWGIYDLRVNTLRDAARRTFWAVTFSLFALASALYFFKIEDFSRLLVGYFYLLDLTFLLLLRVAVQPVFRWLDLPGYGVQRVLIVGEPETCEGLTEAIKQRQGYELVGFVTDDPNHDSELILGPVLATSRFVRELGVNEVLVVTTGTSRSDLAELVLDLREQTVRLRLLPDLLDILALRGRIEEQEGLPLIELEHPPIDGLNRVLKRCLDLIGAVVGLMLTAPLMGIIAVAIKLDSPGPVFFVQKRAGLYGRPFRMYKFRSMREGAEDQLSKFIDIDRLDPPVFKLKDDPRVTRVGRILRRTSLDELPQLINVLRGDMSLVGPRPEEARLVRRYDAWYRQRLVVKPGITGIMQVSGRGELPLDDRVKLELGYIQNYSIWTDIKILLKTLPAVVSGKGSF